MNKQSTVYTPKSPVVKLSPTMRKVLETLDHPGIELKWSGQINKWTYLDRGVVRKDLGLVANKTHSALCNRKLITNSDWRTDYRITESGKIAIGSKPAPPTPDDGYTVEPITDETRKVYPHGQPENGVMCKNAPQSIKAAKDSFKEPLPTLKSDTMTKNGVTYYLAGRYETSEQAAEFAKQCKGNGLEVVRWAFPKEIKKSLSYAPGKWTWVATDNRFAVYTNPGLDTITPKVSVTESDNQPVKITLHTPEPQKIGTPFLSTIRGLTPLVDEFETKYGVKPTLIKLNTVSQRGPSFKGIAIEYDDTVIPMFTAHLSYDPAKATK